MNNFDKLKSFDIDQLAEWLDVNGMWDNSPWSLWWDRKYCQNCESVKAPGDNYWGFKSNCGYAYCEVENKCRYFPDHDDVPDCKEIVKMWLEAEVEDV